MECVDCLARIFVCESLPWRNARGRALPAVNEHFKRKMLYLDGDAMLHCLTKRSPDGKLSIALLLLMLCLSLAGCTALQSLGLGGSKLPPPSMPIVADARAAWDAEDMTRAENLYGRVLKTKGITQGEQREAWERLALAANRNGRPNRALQALDKWHAADVSADALSAWQDAWLNSVRTLTPGECVSRAKKLWNAKKYSAGARNAAAVVLLGRSWTPAQAVPALPSMTAVYTLESRERRAALERILSNELRYMTLPTLQQLTKGIGPDKERSFPYSVLLLEQARRESVTPGGDSAALLARINKSGTFADSRLIRAVMGDKAPSGESAPAVSGANPTYQPSCLVLALPTSGAFNAVAAKITRGAQAAQQELGQAGVPVQLQTINTDLPDWTAQLDALPAQCVLVGGPLQPAIYTAAKANGVTGRRVFFTFLQQLGPGEEGVAAWRFFPSPQDQVDALLRFTRRDLGITQYASLHPSDAYGARMTGIFEKAVRAGGGTLRTAGYDPKDMAGWTKVAENLVQPRMVNKVPIPTADFGAVFLPDSWKNMEMITTSLLYNGEDRQVLLGTALWEQGLTGQSVINAANFDLAVFPGAWNRHVVPPALQGLGATDFWVGLGYDFVRFGATMGLNAPTTPPDVTAKAQRAQNIPWAMAPLHWNSTGQASQQMFLFTPTSAGFEPLNVEAFKERRARIQTRFDSRVRAASGGTAQ